LTAKLKVDGAWKNIASIKLKVDGVWKNVAQGYLKVSGAWKLFFSSTIVPSTADDSEITQSTNSTSWLITLTGKYYHWENADVLNYRFEKSIDAGATWSTIDSGLDIVNPSVGSYETVTYQLDDSPSDVSPNVENKYRFVIEATKTSPSATTTNESDSTSVYGPENVVITVGTITYTDISFSWTSSPNAQKYLVYYKRSVDSSYVYSKVISGTNTTIDSLSPSTSYDFKVIPITGVSNTYQGYLGNPAYLLNTSTNTPVAPTQNSAPTKGSGTGEFGTLVYKGSPGSYSNALNVDTRLVYLNSASVPSSGTTTDLAVAAVSSPRTITQTDFTYISRRFYTQDDVTALDGVTHYYYYSPGITAYVDDMSDTFNRSNASGGLGTTSTGLQYDSSRSNYGSYWAVLNNRAYSSVSVSSNYTDNPMQAIEAGGKYDIIGGLNYPNNGGGYGVAFWVTSANSWWAASTYYNQVSTSGTSCTGTGGSNRTGCPTIGTNVGDACGCVSQSGSEYACSTTLSEVGTACPSSGFGTGPGQYCNCIDYSTTYYACTEPGSSGSSCTNSNNQTPGGACNCTSTTTTSYACDQTGGSNTTGCPASGTGPGDVCGCNSVYTPAVPSTCSDSFSGFSSCPAYGNNEGQRCSTGCTSSTTYFCGSYVFNRGSCGSTGTLPYGPSDVGLRCGECYGSPGSYFYTVIQSTTTYSGTLWSASSPAYTTYSWNKRSTTGTATTTYSWSTRSNSVTTVTGKQWFTRDSTPTNFTTYSWNTIVSVAGSTYSSYIKVNKSNGSSVSEEGSLQVASSTSGYVNIPNLVLVTSGNSILVSAFNGSTQIGNTLSITGSAPSSSTSGVAAGIIKMHTPYNEANYVDNLQILPS
jgi:hypothetical protein